MKKTIAFVTFCFYFSLVAFSQAFKGQIDSIQLPRISALHYVPEYDLDAPVDSNAWKKVKPGMHVSFGSEDELYYRAEVPQIKNEDASWEATGWKGERLISGMKRVKY
jgi:hypothetical protein